MEHLLYNRLHSYWWKKSTCNYICLENRAPGFRKWLWSLWLPHQQYRLLQCALPQPRSRTHFIPATCFIFPLLLTYLNFLSDLFDFYFICCFPINCPLHSSWDNIGHKSIYISEEQEEEMHQQNWAAFLVLQSVSGRVGIWPHSHTLARVSLSLRPESDPQRAGRLHLAAWCSGKVLASWVSVTQLWRGALPLCNCSHGQI